MLEIRAKVADIGEKILSKNKMAKKSKEMTRLTNNVTEGRRVKIGKRV
jgi:hypothetical protein